MATILADGRVKSDKGIETPQQGAWYDGQRYLDGKLLGKNEYEPGKFTSPEINAQSAAAQGKTVQEFNDYLFGKSSTLSNNASRNAGVGTNTSSGGGAPSLSSGGGKSNFNVTEEYDRLAKELGISDLKAGVDAKAAEITARRQRLAEAQATINENPFYAEGTRVGKSRRLDEAAQADITNLQREQALAQAKVDEANQQLGVKSNLGVQQYNIDRQAQQDAVSELNTLLSAKTNLSGINVDEFAAKTGMSSSTIQALVAASAAKEIKPTVIQSTNDAGVVTVTVIDQNTGAIVGQQSLGAIGNAQNSSSKASEAEVSRYYLNNLRADVGTGIGVQQAFQLYAGYLDPNQIIQIYNATSPNGPAKESSAQLAAYGVKPYVTEE